MTQPDQSADHNVTSIYRTPEHGVAAWYHLITKIYSFISGSFTLEQLAEKYAGGNNRSAIDAYLEGWSKWLSHPLSTTTEIGVGDIPNMILVGRAMFSHEAGQSTPVQDVQIEYGIQHEIKGPLPP